MQVGLQLAEPGAGIAVGRDGPNGDIRVSGEEAQDFSTGITAGA